MQAWRLGRRPAPCDFVPRDKCSWNNRFDDPFRRYRTVYCAKKSITCLREVLADLRPNKSAYKELNRLFPGQTELPNKGRVSVRWRESHALARAEVLIATGVLADMNDVALRRRMEQRHADLLVKHGMKGLALKEIRSKNREVTRAISRTLYDSGNAGVQFPSSLDDQPCYAIFEGRARLDQRGRAIPMTDDAPELLKVCEEFELILLAA